MGDQEQTDELKARHDAATLALDGILWQMWHQLKHEKIVLKRDFPEQHHWADGLQSAMNGVYEATRQLTIPKAPPVYCCDSDGSLTLVKP